MVFDEMRPRVRHRLSDIRLTVGESLGKTQPDNQLKRESNTRPSVTPVLQLHNCKEKYFQVSSLEVSRDRGKKILRHHMMKDEWNREKFYPAPGFEPGFSALRAELYPLSHTGFKSRYRREFFSVPLILHHFLAKDREELDVQSQVGHFYLLANVAAPSSFNSAWKSHHRASRKQCSQ
ncbi:hypothetical protein ANN_23181 [Periplaneta americana]|uniref:Uncharacterized protein n=1 Tax=Periplaneta americana TaxID=6978 RepID=A0ABQ8SKE1_PERAM|nr:hypothetical protein ANN_23181 [Periplaneta americana]